MLQYHLAAFSQFVGKPVKSMVGEDLGTLWNFVVDQVSGNVAYAILQTEDRLIGFVWDEFRLGRDGTFLELAMTREALAEIPGFQPPSFPLWRDHEVQLLTEAECETSDLFSVEC